MDLPADLFRRLVDDAPETVLVHDLEGRLVYANDRACRMLGYDPGEILRLSVPDIEVHSSPETMGLALHALIPGRPIALEGLHRRKDGSTFPVEIRLTRLGADLVLALARDLSERREGEEQLRESQRLLAEAQAIAHVGTWRWDITSNRVTWSDELYRIHGIGRREFGATYEGYLARVHPEDRERVERTIAAALRERHGFRFDERIVRPDGSVRTLHSVGEVTLDAEDRPIRMIGVCQDVTDQKTLEENLRRARDAALESVRLKASFLANMSHEVRTPLNIIIGYVELLEGALVRSRDREPLELIDAIRRASHRLVGMLHGILDLSQIEAGVLEVKPAPLLLAPVVERQVEAFRPLAAAKGVALSCRDAAPGAVVRFDEHCLEQAVIQLLENAIKFTESGSISVTLLRDASGTLALEVRDTGVGIDGAFLPRLFEPFVQEESGYTRRFEGAGLGLALTRKYLELNGAAISVASRKGDGTAVTIRFPPELESTAVSVPPAA
jgi:PAS domain S-box-containing protein